MDMRKMMDTLSDFDKFLVSLDDEMMDEFATLMAMKGIDAEFDDDTE